MSKQISPFDLDGKVALVSGGARGIGAAAACALARAGAKVLVTDILDELGQAMAAQIRQDGGVAEYLHLNVCAEEDWVQAVNAAVEQFGGLDILVNNAGVESFEAISDIELADWRRLQAINVDGVFLGLKQAVLAMKPGGAAGRGGSIINMSSSAGFIGAVGLTSYCASKGAVRLLTKAAAVECATFGFDIRVNSVHPGIIMTDMWEHGLTAMAEKFLGGDRDLALQKITAMTPGGRTGTAADVADVVLFLASDASRFVNGSEQMVDYGLTAM